MRRSSRPTAEGRVPFLSPHSGETPSPSCSATAAQTPASPVLLPSPVAAGSSCSSMLPLQRAGPLHSHSTRHSHTGMPNILQAGGGPIPSSSHMSSSGLASPRSTLSGPSFARAADEEPKPGSRSWWNSLTREEVSLLLSAYAVLFSRYLVSQQLAGFFTSVADNAGISSSWVGLIFMAYPLGMSITSVVAPSIVRRIGTRNALSLGLSATVLANLGFGLTPDFCSQPLDDVSLSAAGGAATGSLCLRLTFWSLYFINGLVGATAETACIILLSSRFQPVLGTVMAHVNTASTCGCFVGSFIGGLLYDAGPDDSPATKFRLPFFATSVFVALLLPLRCALPQEYLGADSATAAPMRSVVSRSIVLGLTAVMLSAAVLGTLDTNLPYRLQAPPFWLTMSELAAVTSLSSGAYLFLMFPIGYLVGKASSSSRRLKIATGSGFLVLAAAFALLGPVGAWGSINSTPFAVAAMLLRAAGSAVSCNFVYPDLVFGIPPDDSRLHATISTLWNAAYAIGWAVGPYAGGLLYAAFSRESLCTILQKGACTDPGSGGHPGCSCVWRPDNGFVGFCNVTVAVCGAFAAVNFTAAAFNVHDQLPPPPKLTPPEMEPDQGLQPAGTSRAERQQAQ